MICVLVCVVLVCALSVWKLDDFGFIPHQRIVRFVQTSRSSSAPISENSSTTSKLNDVPAKENGARRPSGSTSSAAPSLSQQNPIPPRTRIVAWSSSPSSAGQSPPAFASPTTPPPAAPRPGPDSSSHVEDPTSLCNQAGIEPAASSPSAFQGRHETLVRRPPGKRLGRLITLIQWGFEHELPLLKARLLENLAYVDEFHVAEGNRSLAQQPKNYTFLKSLAQLKQDLREHFEEKHAGAGQHEPGSVRTTTGQELHGGQHDGQEGVEGGTSRQQDEEHDAGQQSGPVRTPSLSTLLAELDKKIRYHQLEIPLSERYYRVQASLIEQAKANIGRCDEDSEEGGCLLVEGDVDEVISRKVLRVLRECRPPGPPAGEDGPPAWNVTVRMLHFRFSLGWMPNGECFWPVPPWVHGNDVAQRPRRRLFGEDEEGIPQRSRRRLFGEDEDGIPRRSRRRLFGEDEDGSGWRMVHGNDVAQRSRRRLFGEDEDGSGWFRRGGGDFGEDDEDRIPRRSRRRLDVSDAMMVGGAARRGAAPTALYEQPRSSLWGGLPHHRKRSRPVVLRRPELTASASRRKLYVGTRHYPELFLLDGSPPGWHLSWALGSGSALAAKVLQGRIEDPPGLAKQFASQGFEALAGFYDKLLKKPMLYEQVVRSCLRVEHLPEGVREHPELFGTLLGERYVAALGEGGREVSGGTGLAVCSKEERERFNGMQAPGKVWWGRWRDCFPSEKLVA